MIFGVVKIYAVWSSLEEQLHLSTIETKKKKKKREKYVDYFSFHGFLEP